MRTSSIYSELLYRARESATTSHIRLRLRTGIGVGKPSGGKQGRLVLLTACEVGKLEVGWQEDGHPTWLLRGTYWYLYHFPTFGSQWKGWKMRKLWITDQTLTLESYCCWGWGLVFHVGCCKVWRSVLWLEGEVPRLPGRFRKFCIPKPLFHHLQSHTLCLQKLESLFSKLTTNNGNNYCNFE